MKIKNVEIKNNLFLAPMAGITDKAFRCLCKKFGVGLTYTEMVSVKGLFYNSKNTKQLLDTFESESPCAVQLFGNEPEVFRTVIKSGVLDKFDIIDINMGCPAPKIVKNGDGSSLMKDLNLASEIIKACVESTDKPITVKFRKGFYKTDDKLTQFAKMCESSGASAITVHPRTREDFFSGEIDIEDIKKVKQAVNIPVIGNGDVVDENSYKKMLSSGCDGVMIG
ncbi:MAG: tRNA-dihydrouridine synthase family protein, partial [Clostridia bacterium]|nr:tRNA-dihydrouridine synthase family protein [Clostridia bacterium]